MSHHLLRILLAAPLAAGMAAGEALGPYVESEPDGTAWRIGNAAVERRVRFDAGRGLFSEAWIHKATGADFMKAPDGSTRRADEFHFNAGDTRLSGRSKYELTGAAVSALEPGGKLLRIGLRSLELPLDVAVCYAVYGSHPVVRKWVEITNRGREPVTLTQLAFESVGLAPGVPGELQAYGGYGVDPRELYSTGRASDTAILVENSRTREGLAVMNEAPGYTKRTEVCESWRDRVRAMYDTDLFPFERRILPKETWASAKCSIAFYRAGQAATDPRWVLPSYTSEVMLRKGAGYQPPWIYNTWEPFGRNIDEAATRKLITAAGRMGLDLFTIDDGWQQRHGDNAIRTSHFPRGLEPVGAWLAERRMSLGLWVPLAAISLDAPDAAAHPEWLAKDSRGRLKFTGTAAGRQGVMCLASGYRELAARRLNALIAAYQVKYLKVDLTTVFNTYGEEPGCHAAGHDHQSPAESLIRIYEGMQFISDKVRREHPETYLDYTFELWGEKHLIDHGLLAAADMDWLSNVRDGGASDAGPRQARMLAYRRALSMPVEAMLVGNLRANAAPIEERFATVLAFGPVLLGDLRKLDAKQQDWYAEKIRWFKALRARVPIWQGFFPLGAWTHPNAAAWDGFARLSRRGEGIIVAFRNESAASTAQIRLPALPAGDYVVRPVVGDCPPATLRAADLERGWAAPLKGRVLILEIRPK